MIFLDTHVFVWYLSKPENLSKKAQAKIEHDKHEGIGVSTISTFEICLLVRKDRLKFSIPVLDWIHTAESLDFLNFIAPTNAIMHAAVSLDIHIQDPADRIIIATSMLHEGILITKDNAIRQLSDIQSLW